MRKGLTGRIAELEAFLAAREGKTNFAENVAEIRAEIVRLRREQEARDNGPAAG